MASKKPTRLPRYVRNPVPEKRFRAKVLRRIHLDRERAFVDEAFELNDGTRRLRDSLSADDRKRLARVLKEAKKNRGLFRMGRLAAVLVILGLIVGGAALFKDRLMTRALEELLTLAAGAESNVDDLSFRPLRGQLSTGSIQITDAGRPTHNVVSLESTSLSISSVDLLRGSVIVELMEGTGLAFGSRRETPGEVLEGGGAAAGIATAGDAAVSRGSSALEETIASLSLDRDPAEIIAGLRDQLRSEALITDATADARRLAEEWQQQVSRTSDDIERLEGLVADAREVQPTDLTDPAALREARTLLASVRSDGQAVLGEIRNDYDALSQQLSGLQALPGQLQAAVDADMELLRAQIPDGSLNLDSLARSTLETFVVAFLGDSYGRITGIVSRVEALRSLGGDPEDAAPRGPGRGGTDIAFGTTALPRFLLREARLEGPVTVSLAQLSSDPDLTGLPVELAVDAERYRAAGTVDLRERAAERATYQVVMPDLNLDLPASAAGMGFSDLGGMGLLQLTGSLDAEDVARGVLDIDIDPLSVDAEPDAGRATRLIGDLLTEAGAVQANLSYELADGRLRRLEGESSLRDALAGGVAALTAGLRDEAEARLRAELDAQVAARLEAYSEQLAILNELEITSLEQLASAETYRDALSAQEAEITERLAAIEGEIRAEAERLEAEARAQAAAAEEQARAEAERREAEAQAAADAAAEEAQSQVEDAVRDRLPGFGRR